MGLVVGRSSSACKHGARCAVGMIVIGFLVATAAHGQNSIISGFEVVSVKTGGDSFSTKPTRSDGRIRWTTQLCYMIGYAYNLSLSRVSGSKCGAVYSVEATFNPATTDDQLRLMIQSLLADRFELRAHLVTKQVDGYALVIGKGGIKMKAAEIHGEPPGMPEWVKSASPALRTEKFISATVLEPGVVAVTGRGVSIRELAQTLERSMKEPVPIWDRTGLSGSYYFAFRYTQFLSPDLETDAPLLATALEQNLGLKLEKEKGPVQTLVIDHIATPSAN